jgi:hypothetical protein
MKQFLLLIFLAGSTYGSFCQTNDKKNTVYYQFGGNGFFSSLNYERQLLRKQGLGVHIGAGVYGVKTPTLTIPFGVNYLFAFNNTRAVLDLGAGVTYTKADALLYLNVKRAENAGPNTQFFNFIPSLGYRIHTPKHMMYRFSFTPVFNQYGGIPFLGFSMGKRF